MGSRVEELRARWGHYGDIHLLRRENTIPFCEAAEELGEAIDNDQSAQAWRRRPPTPAELLAHHSRHARGRWMRRTGPTLQLYTWTPGRPTELPPGEWRALDDEGAPSPWPVVVAGESKS
jgi:hypothetical protein